MTKRFSFFARVPRGCNVAHKATWQRHAGPRGAYVAYTYIYLFHIVNIMGISAFCIAEGYSTHLIIGSYKPDDSVYFFPCGTNPQDVFKMQVTWRQSKCQIVGVLESMRRSHGTRTIDQDQAHTHLLRRYNGRDVIWRGPS